MQERISQPLQSRLDEIDPVFEPGTIVFSDAAAMGIIKVVSVSSFPSQAKDQTEARASSPVRKTYEASLLTWERKHRPQGSSGVSDHLNFSSTEQV